jgi:hypothetical protein
LPQKGFLPTIAKLFSKIRKSSPIYNIRNFRKAPIMGISMNTRTSGFRKWSEAHDPKIAAARAAAGEAAVIAAPEIDQGVTTPKEQPHQPWLVPGTDTL